MFINRPILDLIELIELSFKHHKVPPSLRIKVDNIALKFLKSINNFQEVLIAKEKFEVFLIDLFDNFFNWIKVCILIKESLKTSLRVALDPI